MSTGAIGLLIIWSLQVAQVSTGRLDANDSTTSSSSLGIRKKKINKTTAHFLSDIWPEFSVLLNNKLVVASQIMQNKQQIVVFIYLY